jgi:HAD superfamily hydrolase (TIGR01509 family)
MIKGVVFDFDGTLVDSMKIFFEALNKALGDRNLQTVGLDLLGRMAGRPLSDIVKSKMQIPDPTIEGIEKDVFKANVEFCRKSCRLLPNVESTLRALKAMQVKLGLFTTTPRKPLKVAGRRLGIGNYFDIMLAKDDAKCKPDPDGLEQIIAEFRIEKDECLYVGDSPIDVLTGKAAGVRTIAVATGVATVEQLKENAPDSIITDLEQLLMLINRAKEFAAINKRN